MENIVSVDIGTTSVRAVLYDESGSKEIAQAKEFYGTSRRKTMYAEQNPQEILNAFYKVIREISRDYDISTIALSSAMHSVILVDESLELLSECILWADNRAFKEIKEFKKHEYQQLFYEITGTPIHPMSPFAKLLWFQKQKPEVLVDTRYILDIKSYIMLHMIGYPVVDYSIASATGLFNIHSLSWDNEILEFLDLDVSLLPKVVDVTTSFSILKTQCDALGLKETVTLVIGGSDGCLSNLGLGAIDKGGLVITVGTSGAIRSTVDEITLDPSGKLFCYYAAPGKWVIGGAVNNGGNVLQWAKASFLTPESSFDDLYGYVKKAPVGSEGLIFAPFISGERAPYWNSELTGSLQNIRIIHQKEHFIRACIEGVLYNLYDVFCLLKDQIENVESVKITGGFYKSDIVKEICANIFKVELQEVNIVESSCFGALLLVKPTAISNVHVDTKYSFDDYTSKKYESCYREYVQYVAELT